MKMLVTLAFALSAVSTAALASQTNTAVFVPHSIPAVSQPGLIALAFVVGLIGAHLIRKRQNAKR